MAGLNNQTRSIIFNRPKRLILEISRNCNLNCIMCGFGGHPIDKNWFIDDNILSYLTNKNNINFFSELVEIRLNGRGESTIHPKFADILKDVSLFYPNVRLTLFTNLMSENNNLVNQLNRYNIETYVSIDSSDPKTFENIRRGAKFDIVSTRLKELTSGFLVFTLQKSNFNELEAIGKFAAANNKGLIINIFRTDEPKYKAEFSELLNSNWEMLLEQLMTLHNYIPRNKLLIPDQIWGNHIPDDISTTISCGKLPLCPNIMNELMIAYDGTVYPCNMFNIEEYGNIYKTPIEQIWGSRIHQSFANTHKCHDYCQHCEYMIPKLAIQ